MQVNHLHWSAQFCWWTVLELLRNQSQLSNFRSARAMPAKPSLQGRQHFLKESLNKGWVGDIMIHQTRKWNILRLFWYVVNLALVFRCWNFVENEPLSVQYPKLMYDTKPRLCQVHHHTKYNWHSYTHIRAIQNCVTLVRYSLNPCVWEQDYHFTGPFFPFPSPATHPSLRAMGAVLCLRCGLRQLNCSSQSWEMAGYYFLIESDDAPAALI